MYVCCGLPLGTFSSDVKNFIRQMKTLNQHENIAWAVPPLFLAMNLTGEANPPVEMSWDKALELGIMVGPELKHILEESPARAVILYFGFLYALLIDDMDMAERSMNEILGIQQQYRRIVVTHFANYMFALLDGLGGCILFQKTKKSKYLALAKNGRKDLNKMNSLNSLPLLQLVDAELAWTRRSSKRKRAAVKGLCDKAIVSLVRSGFSHLGAIAYERAGRFMLQQAQDQGLTTKTDAEFWAKEYLEQSVKLYKEWGATIKVNQMISSQYNTVLQHGRMGVGEEQGSSGNSILGRERYGSVASALNKKSELAIVAPVDDDMQNT